MRTMARTTPTHATGDTDPSIDVRSLLRTRFRLVPRGFDQDEVLDLISRLAQRIDTLQRAVDPTTEASLARREHAVSIAEAAALELVDRARRGAEQLLEDVESQLRADAA